MDVKYPIGKLQVPETVKLNDIQKWLEDIGAYTKRLRNEGASLTAEDLHTTYRDGSWTARQLAHHIADSQLNMYQRLKLALTDDNPKVPEFSQDEWAELPDSKLPVESSLKILEGINEHVIALGNSLTEKQLTRVFTHHVNGEIS